MRTSMQHRTRKHSIFGDEPFPRQKGGGSTGTTAVIPDELKPLITHSVTGAIGMQPAAQDWFTGFTDAARNNPQNMFNGVAPGQNTGSVYNAQTDSWSQPLQALQIAPLTATEQGLGRGASAALGGLLSSELGYVDAGKALNLQGPLNQLAKTSVATPQAEIDARNQGLQGLGVLDRTRNLGPTEAYGQYYANLGDTRGLVGQRVGTTAQESSANSALNALTGVAGQQINTPAAETQALAQIANLTGGSLGSSPATQQAITALEQQYNTRALPSLQNQLAQAGLGRSGALEQGVADLRGQLFGAEVPLLQQEISNREQTLPILQNIASAQQGRQTGTMDRLVQALNSQASGFSSLGGQLAGRTQADLQRDLSAQLGTGGQLQSQQQIEQATQNAPIDRELSYLESTFNPLSTMAAQQQARSQIPVDRQLSTAFQAAPAFEAQNQQQMALAQLIGQVGAQPRLQQQAINEAYAQNNQRQQALAESILLGPLGVLPSLIGSQTVSSGGGK